MERVILHVDMNNFYASVECFLNPELRGQAVCVCGDEEQRHGIILAKNQLAKKCGVTTGEPIWQARAKCPQLVCVPANYKNYLRFSALARNIFLRYTGKMEPFGLDEAWLDVSGKDVDIAEGKRLADEIRAVITRELGITASVGVSFNKIFAKLGSDLKKPDATSVLSAENFKAIVWRLPVRELLYVGRSTEQKLRRRSIMTIGDLANAQPQYLQKFLGKWGYMLWNYANGYDTSAVEDAAYHRKIKSIGNSTTTPRDLLTVEDVRSVVQTLSENVAMRLKKYKLKCMCVQVYVRAGTLERMNRQRVLHQPTDLSADLASVAMQLFSEHYSLEKCPVRSVGVRAINLVSIDEKQLNIFEDLKKIEVECAVESLRRRFGENAVVRANVLQNQDLSRLEQGKRSIFPHSNL
ncbi:MAG: DNA polymerase IV [Christensenellaceae bacterium]